MRSIELKLIGFGFILLVIGITATSVGIFYLVRGDIYDLAENRIKSTMLVVSKSIERTMIEGRSDFTKSLLHDIKSASDFENIEVFDETGRPAFDEAGAKEDDPSLNESINSKASIIRRDGALMMFYSPLENKAVCQGCHGREVPVLGVARMTVSLSEEQARVVNFLILISLGSLFGVGFLIFVFWYIVRTFVTSPVRRIESASAKMAEGDLRFDTGEMFDDEIGKLNEAIKDSMFSISSILRKVKEISGRISSTSESVEQDAAKVVKSTQTEAEAVENISSSIEELNAAITEIAENTEGLAVSVEQTASSIEQMASNIESVLGITNDLSSGVEATSSSIEEMSATIKQVAENAEHLALETDDTMSAVEVVLSSVRDVERLSKESARLSEMVTTDASTIGVTSIEKTMKGMERIKSSVERTASAVTKLGGRSDEIGNILNVINEITEQTTLLALNAAILAAQAKEHGKGFSVVADEIKDLAERTAFSTQEIESLIQSVREEVKEAVESMDLGLSSVNEGMKLSKEASEALKKILERSKRSTEMASAIESSTAEQARAAKLVSESTGRVRSMVGQIAKATAEQSKGINLIIEAADKMKEASTLVKSATENQSNSGKQITQVIEIISDNSKHISSAINEQKVGSKQIWTSVEKIKNLPTENRELAFRLNRAFRELKNDSELLVTEMEKFKLSTKKGTSVMRLGIVPLQSPAEMFRRFAPLAEYLEREIGKRIEVRVAKDFETAVNDIVSEETDIAYMTPSTYISARKLGGVNLVAKALREGLPFHHSVIITTKDSGIKSLKDIKGRSFAFGDRNSTSSHIVPRAMLLDAGIDISELSYFNYLGHHDEVAKAVLRGEFDAGGLMEDVAEKYASSGAMVLKVSDPIAEFNIVAGATMPALEFAKIKKSLCALSDKVEAHTRILQAVDKHYTGFQEAQDEDYNPIRLMMTKMGLL